MASCTYKCHNKTLTYWWYYSHDVKYYVVGTISRNFFFLADFLAICKEIETDVYFQGGKIFRP